MEEGFHPNTAGKGRDVKAGKFSINPRHAWKRSALGLTARYLPKKPEIQKKVEPARSEQVYNPYLQHRPLITQHYSMQEAFRKQNRYDWRYYFMIFCGTVLPLISLGFALFILGWW